jgi:hypothetical protein
MDLTVVWSRQDATTSKNGVLQYVKEFQMNILVLLDVIMK